MILGMDPPRVKNLVKGEAFVVQHREYLGDLTSGPTAGNTDFKLQSFPINPGIQATFPWLSTIAPQYQEYKINGLVFEFKSLVADAVISTTSNAIGSVMMATNYNSTQKVFPNKQAMLESEYSSDGRSSMSFIHAIECKPSITAISDKLYVRSGAPGANQDLRLYDWGLFQIASQGQQAANAVLGELWCSYEIWFYKPILSNGTALLMDKYQISTVTAAAPFSTSVGNRALVAGSSLNTTLSNTTITFPTNIQTGNFLIIYSMSGGTPATVNAGNPFVVSTGLTVLAVWQNTTGFDAQSFTDPNQLVANSTDEIICGIISFGPNPTLPATVNMGSITTLPTSTTHADLIITQVNTNVIT